MSDLNQLTRQEKAFLHGWSAQRTLASSQASTTAALIAAANVLQSEGISSTLPETGETLLRKIAPLPKQSVRLRSQAHFFCTTCAFYALFASLFSSFTDFVTNLNPSAFRVDAAMESPSSLQQTAALLPLFGPCTGY